jgi:hypothetical protein
MTRTIRNPKQDYLLSEHLSKVNLSVIKQEFAADAGT